MKTAIVAIFVGFVFLPSGAIAEDTPPDCGIFAYKVEIVRVIDGDTVVVNVDLGFDTWIHDEHLRLVGIEADKAGTARGDEATQALKDEIEGQPVFVCTQKMKTKDREAEGSFGRYLATIWVDGKNVNQWLLDHKFVSAYEH